MVFRRFPKMGRRSGPCPAFLSGGVVKVSVAALLVVTAGLTLGAPAPAAARNSGGAAAASHEGTGHAGSLADQAIAAAGRDRFDDARRLAARSASPVLEKLVRWMDYTSSQPTGSFDDITAFIEANPDWPRVTVLRRHAEEAITAATPAPALLAWFTRHPPVTVDGGMAYGRALLETGQTAKAVDIVRHTWVAGGFGPLQERQFLARFGQYLRPEDNRARLDRLLWDRQDAAARHMLLRVDAAHRQLAQARLALQEDAGNTASVVAAVPPVLRDDPGLIFDRVRWRRVHDMDEDAIDLLSHPARNKVRPDLWWQERSILARRALQKGLMSRAYQVAADNGLPANSPQRADADFLAGWIALRFLDDKETAATHFERLWSAVSTPLSRSRAAYWAGRAAESRGDEAAARQWFTRGAAYVTAYYGQLAAARLNRHHWPLPADPRPSPEDARWLAASQLAQAARLLLAADAGDRARPFFIRLDDLAQTPGERALVADLAEKGGRPDLAVAVARRADRDGVTLVRAGWPTLPIAIDSTAEKALVLALIRQESGFHRTALSPTGARGLMQLMPATALRVARAIRVAFSPRKLDDPRFNVRLGSAYLDGLLDDFQGSYILALAAYNAGPARARRWIRDFGDPRDPKVDVVDWIETIPFTETRNYVQRVMENVEIYRRRLGVADGGGLEADLKRWARRSAS